MKLQYKDSIDEAKRLLRTSRDVGHDLNHGRRVARNARLIGQSLGFDDIDLLVVCGWWHDVGRLQKPNHEKLSAKLMSQDLARRGVDYRTRHRAYKAVYMHRWDMQPKTTAGKIIKDADKLDFISVDRWRQREAAGQNKTNQRNLSLLPYIRRHFYFNASRQLFDQRLGAFAENLEHSGTLPTTTRTLVTV